MQSNTETEKNRRILVIDDNPAIHSDFEKILVTNDSSADLASAADAFFGETTARHNRVSVELQFASQGEDGYEMVRQAVADGHPFAMAFVDMRMPPGWDGLRTISEIWKVDPDIQVVICSAYSDHSWSHITETLGESDRLLILKKPFDNAEVLQLSSALIEKRHLTIQARARTKELEALVNERTAHLQESREDSERLINSIDSILIGLDKNGIVSRWNAPSETVFGLSHAEVMGKRFVDLPIQWIDSSVTTKLIGSHSSRIETTITVSAGIRKILGLSSYPVFHNECPDGSLILGADLTAHRSLESQLLQAQKLESVGQLAAGVAHEINTPMQYLGDNLDYLEKKVQNLSPAIDGLEQLTKPDLPEETRAQLLTELIETAQKLKLKKFIQQLEEAISDSRDGVQHVSTIVRAMKEFAHPGQDEMTPVDINRALESTIAVSTNEWKYVAKVETRFDETAPCVMAMAVELNQVFLNILVNAAHTIDDFNRKHGVAQGIISVSSKQLANCVEVTISDTGTGIPDSVKQRIFDPFFTTKDVGKGTGQGLSIAHSVIVKKHGGRLWCESPDGCGTTFFIQIPLAKAAYETSETPDREPAMVV